MCGNADTAGGTARVGRKTVLPSRVWYTIVAATISPSLTEASLVAGRLRRGVPEAASEPGEAHRPAWLGDASFATDRSGDGAGTDSARG